MLFTRRFVLGLMAAGARRLFADATGQRQPGVRGYRVDATIILFSLPVFSRPGVGRGYARCLTRQSSDRSVHEMEFAAGSFPERAHGLKRLGMIRETVAEAGSGILQADYFGFMTLSQEESVGDARKALSSSEGTNTFVAIEGESRPGEAYSRRARFNAEGTVGWNQHERLAREAAAAIRNPNQASGESRFSTRDNGAVPTFLFAISRALTAGRAQMKQTYVYSRAQYELTTTRKSDSRMGRRLAEKGLVSKGESVVVLNGVIRNLQTGVKTPFRIWTGETSGAVPLRIEFQPRGFLQLALEAEG